jgi:hypothetical protein
MPRKGAAPPVIFDGWLHWYTEWFDPADDCCSLCRGPIAEEDVPLILFKEVKVAGQTWQARICEACMPVAFAKLQAR